MNEILKTDVEMQVKIAKDYPRDIKQFINELNEMVFIDKEVYENCFYAYHRKDYDGKMDKKELVKTHNQEISSKQKEKNIIIGPSIRLAEIALACWGNAKAASFVVSEDDKFVTAEGIFWDTQKNLEIRKQVKSSIAGKYGKYSDNLIAVTCNAACSKAFRNAVFTGIPRIYIDSIFNECKKRMLDDFEENRNKCFAYFNSQGVETERLLAFFNCANLEDFTINELMASRGILNAIKDGECSLLEAFNLSNDVQEMSVKDKISYITENKRKIKALEDVK